MIDEVFKAWWVSFGSSFERKAGFKLTQKEIARYAFKAGWKSAGIPGLETLFIPPGNMDADSIDTLPGDKGKDETDERG